MSWWYDDGNIVKKCDRRTDGRTDVQTDGRTDGLKCSSYHVYHGQLKISMCHLVRDETISSENMLMHGFFFAVYKGMFVLYTPYMIFMWWQNSVFPLVIVLNSDVDTCVSELDTIWNQFCVIKKYTVNITVLHSTIYTVGLTFNTLRPELNGLHFANDISKHIFFKKKFFFWFQFLSSCS